MGGWVGNTPDVLRAIRIARRNEARLGPADRQLLRVFIGSRPPASRTGGDFIRATEAYVSLAPDAADAWYRLGEGYFHYGRAYGYPDATKRAARAIERSLQLDSTYLPALEHLQAIYAELGDSAGFRRARALLARDTTQSIYPVHRLVAEYVTGDSARIADARAGIEQFSRAAKYKRITLGFAAWHRSATCSASSMRRWLRPRSTRRTEQCALHEGGAGPRSRPASRCGQESFAGRTFQRCNTVTGCDVVGWRHGERRPGQATHDGPSASGGGGDTSYRHHTAALYNLTTLALYHASRGDTVKARNEMRRAQGLSIAGDSMDFTGRVRRSVALVEAQLAVIGRRPDLRQRLATLDSAVGEAYENLISQIGPFISARGWEAAGDNAKAREMIARRLVYIGGVEFAQSTRLREEGRLAALVGDRDGAIKAYRLFLHMRNAPEPSLKADADRVRAALARLERGR